MPAKRTAKKKQPREAAAEIVATPNEKLVDEAVRHINRLLRETMYKAATTVGEYVFRVFFHGDAALVHSKDSTKNVSFRALAQKCGTAMPISKSWLHSAVAIVVMKQALPDGAVFNELLPTHQVALLPVHNPQVVERLAKRAAEKKLSVQALKVIVGEEVAKTRDDDAPRGRPRMPTITKALDRADKLFTFDDGRRFTKAMLDELGVDEVPRAVRTAKSLIARLEGLVEKLEARG